MSRRAIDRVRETVAVEMHQRFSRLALDRQVDEDVLVHRVVIPHVVRCHLERPHHFAGVSVASQNRRRPLVVAGALVLVPRPGVAGAVIDQIERRIVRDPSPYRAPAGLPRITWPRRDTEILAAIVGVKRFELRANLHILVGANVVGAPDLLPRRRIECGDPAPHSHLSTARANDDLPLHHDWRHGDRLAAGEIAHLRSPDLSPARCVDSNRVSVEQVVEDFAVSVGSATIHDITARSSNRLLRIRGTEFPFQRLAHLCQIDRVRDIRIRRHDVHRVADDERLSLVSTQHTGRECPHHAQVCGVLRCYRGQLAVARAGIISRRHLPFTGRTSMRDGNPRTRERRSSCCGCRCRLRLRARAVVRAVLAGSPAARDDDEDREEGDLTPRLHLLH